MKNIKYILFIGSLFFFMSCEKNTNLIFDGDFNYVSIENPGSNDIVVPRINDGAGTPSEFVIRLVGNSSSPVNVSYEIDAASTAVENLHYTFSGNGSAVINAGESRVSVPYTILDDNFGLGDAGTLILNITGADVQVDDMSSSATHNLSVDCTSDIAGVVNYEHTATDMNGREYNYSGTTEIETLGTTGTEFTVEDMSFEFWEEFGIEDDTKGLKFVAECGSLSIGGFDGFSNPWNIDEVLESGGSTLKYRWSNFNDQSGVVTLTRQDGADWPTFQ